MGVLRAAESGSEKASARLIGSWLPKRFGLGLAGLIAVGLPLPAFAQPAREPIVPSERVENWVNVRQGPGTDTPTIARLKPGEVADLIELVPSWYRVQLPDGTVGYVSRGWTKRSAADLLAGAISRVHLIDVGTGLAVFVEGPGFTLLYDAGSNDDTAKGANNRVLAYLRRVRPDLTAIDHVVLSHPHQDHVELMPDVLATYQVRNFWDSGRLHPICTYRATLKLIRDRGTLYHDAHDSGAEHVAAFPAGRCGGRPIEAETVTLAHAARIRALQQLPLGRDTTMTFLNADATPYRDVNDNSLVLALDLGRTRLLFMGDAGGGSRDIPSRPPAADSIEGRLLRCCKSNLRSDILVAGHHGSTTSSRRAILDVISAYHFLVSSGPKRYSGTMLPDADVIAEFRERGELHRTDIDDAACAATGSKVGTDNDGQPGGCSNIVLTVEPSGKITTTIVQAD